MKLDISCRESAFEVFFFVNFIMLIPPFFLSIDIKATSASVSTFSASSIVA